MKLDVFNLKTRRFNIQGSYVYKMFGVSYSWQFSPLGIWDASRTIHPMPTVSCPGELCTLSVRPLSALILLAFAVQGHSGGAGDHH